MKSRLPLGTSLKRVLLWTWAFLLLFAALVRPGAGGEQSPAGRHDVAKSATPEFVDSTGMKLVLIPAGEFFMGRRQSPWEICEAFEAVSGDARLWGEDPLHRVRITKPFYLGKYEVTVGQFRRFVQDKSCKTIIYQTDAEWGGGGAVGIVSKEQKFNWRSPGFGEEFLQTDEHPVVCVSWNDANRFCEWLSHKESKTYRLPTEAEWEYACRAGTSTLFHNGDDPQQVVQVANVCDTTVRAKFPESPCYTTTSDGHLYTAPVGSYGPNAWGLHDMHGNVWEWCQDRYDPDYYLECPGGMENPQGPGAVPEPVTRVGRGGCWAFRTLACRSEFRCGFPPAEAANVTGFRVVREP